MSEWSNDVIERQRQAENTTHILLYLLYNYDFTFINNNNTFVNNASASIKLALIRTYSNENI